LAPDTVVPPSNGSAARTLGMARAVRPHVGGVVLECFSTDAAPATAPDGLDIVHIAKPTAGPARALHLARMFSSGSFGFRFPALLSEPRSIVQLESPLLFEAARAAGLGAFILNAHNIYQDMAHFPQARLAEAVFHRMTAGRQARVEHACWRAAGHIFFCSEQDRQRAEHLQHGIVDKSSVVPNCVDAARFTPRPSVRFAGGGSVLFIGTTRYPPNFFAIEELCTAIAPALPELTFQIVGDATLKPRRLPANVRFAGQVPSTAAHLAAAQVAVAPLRHGSGTRLKLLEFFAAGLPVVCTAKAAEGLDVEDGREVRFAETAAEFIASIRALHADPAAAAALGAAARSLVERRYDWAAHVPHMLGVYARLSALTAARP
jgi:glycosyltransferase involved in cell wall biosynthesis